MAKGKKGKANVPAKTKTNLPAQAGGFEQFEGAGMENVTAADMLVPRLTILQSLSPQLSKKKTEYIEGAEIGNIADVGTGDLYQEGIIFLPVYYRKDYLEWAPRASGKGLINIHADPAILDQCTRNERNQPILANGNYVAETAQFFGLNLSAPDRRRCFIPMASTQLKKARKWVTLATGEKLKRADGTEFIAPLFYRTYALTTAEESNNDGDWSGWVINRGEALPEIDPAMFGVPWQQLRDEAVQFLDALMKGDVRADVASMSHDETDQAASQDAEAM